MRALLLALVLPLCLAVAVPVARADQAGGQGRADLLLDLMGIDEVIGIMRAEGLAYGAELADDMLSRGGGATWDLLVDRIHDADKMRDKVRARFIERFGQADPEPLIAFFQSDTGQRIVALEIETRLAFMDEAIEQAAREAFRAIAADLTAPSPRSLDPHLLAIEAYIEANDLIGFNVMSAMNANRQFYRGLVAGGAVVMSEADIMADLRAQQDATEADTSEWIYAFLMMAYAPLDAAQINSYADLSLTPAGRAMNSALFDAFDLMYGDISKALGRAIAGQMQGDEL